MTEPQPIVHWCVFELAFRDKEVERLALGSALVEKFGVQP
jgi:hypothetical protein